MTGKKCFLQILFTTTLFLFSFIHSGLVHAKAAPQKPATAAAKPATETCTKQTKADTSNFKERVYNLGSHLQLEFIPRADGKLNVRLKNSGPAVHVQVFNQDYYLGTNDTVELPHPNVSSYYIQVTPYSRETIWRPLWSSAHEREYLVIVRTVADRKAAVQSNK